jgi:hypothetical protein
MAQILTAVSGSQNSILNTDGSVNTPPPINPAGYYFIDWSKLTKVEDLILLLSAVGFNFNPSHPSFETIKGFLDLNNPIVPQQQPVGEKVDIKLPKINKV